MKKERAIGWESMVKDIQQIAEQQEAIKKVVMNKIGKDEKEKNQKDLNEVENGFVGL